MEWNQLGNFEIFSSSHFDLKQRSHPSTFLFLPPPVQSNQMKSDQTSKAGFNWSPNQQSSNHNRSNHKNKKKSIGRNGNNRKKQKQQTPQPPKQPQQPQQSVPSGYVSHDDSRRRGYNSHDELNSNRRSTRRGYNSNDELLTPERLSRQKNNKNWRNASGSSSSPAADPSVIAYGSALANWGTKSPIAKARKIGRRKKRKSDPSSQTTKIDWRSESNTIGTNLGIGLGSGSDPLLTAAGTTDTLSLSAMVAAQRPTADVRKYKTSLCSHYIKSGECQFGSNCIFAHGEDELNTSVPKRKSKQPPQINWNNVEKSANSNNNSNNNGGIRGRSQQQQQQQQQSISSDYSTNAYQPQSDYLTKSIWMPPQPQAPVGMSMNNNGNGRTPAQRLDAMLNGNGTNGTNGTPNSANSNHSRASSDDTTPERVGVLENEVKQLRRALFLQQQSKKDRQNNGSSSTNSSPATSPTKSGSRKRYKKPNSPRGIKGHPLAQKRFSMLHIFIVMSVMMSLVGLWGSGYLDQYLGRNSNVNYDGNDGNIHRRDVGDNMNEDSSSQSQTAAGSGAKRSVTGSNKDVIIQSRLNENDVVWALTKDRGWRLGHIQRSNNTHTISVEHVAVHLLTTDPGTRTKKDLLHIRKYDQLRRVHPHLLLDRSHIVSYKKVVNLLISNNNGKVNVVDRFVLCL